MQPTPTWPWSSCRTWRDAYRDLIERTDGFVEWFRAVTPLVELADLNIGSRPASRRPSDRIQDLRAIPWVFSWSQCRIMLPGWYGAGTAFDGWHGHDPSRLDLLRDLYRRWGYFRTVMSNMAMVLAKSDLAIAAAYGRLVPDAALADRMFAWCPTSTNGLCAMCSRSRVARRC